EKGLAFLQRRGYRTLTDNSYRPSAERTHHEGTPCDRAGRGHTLLSRPGPRPPGHRGPESGEHDGSAQRTRCPAAHSALLPGRARPRPRCVRDLDSGCGPRVNSVRVAGGAMLLDGQEIAIADVRLHFRMLCGGKLPSPAPALDPAWRTPEVLLLARSLYGERRF